MFIFFLLTEINAKGMSSLIAWFTVTPFIQCVQAELLIILLVRQVYSSRMQKKKCSLFHLRRFPPKLTFYPPKLIVGLEYLEDIFEKSVCILIFSFSLEIDEKFRIAAELVRTIVHICLSP